MTFGTDAGAEKGPERRVTGNRRKNVSSLNSVREEEKKGSQAEPEKAIAEKDIRKIPLNNRHYELKPFGSIFNYWVLVSN